MIVHKDLNEDWDELTLILEPENETEKRSLDKLAMDLCTCDHVTYHANTGCYEIKSQL